MTYAVGKDAQLFANQYNLTSYLTGASPEMSVDLVDKTVFGDTGRRNQPSLISGGIGFDGFYDRATGSAFDVIRTALQSVSQQVVGWFPEGSTVGYPCDLCYANATKMGTPVKVGELNLVTGYFQSAESGIDLGVSLHALAARTSTGNGTSVDNGAATTNGGVGFVWITAATLTDEVEVKVQHSADGSTWADLSVVVSRASAGSARVEVAAGTTVNRYTRAVWTFSGTGTITFVAAFARR